MKKGFISAFFADAKNPGENSVSDRGFIFTIDALLAIFLIVITVEFILVNFLQTQDKEVLFASLHDQVTEKTIVDFYLSTPPAAPNPFTKSVAACNSYYVYNPDNGIVGPGDPNSWTVNTECLERNP